MPDVREPTITVNGQTLSEAQAMTVRVAVSSFGMLLREDGAPPSASIEAGYLRQVAAIEGIIAHGG